MIQCVNSAWISIIICIFLFCYYSKDYYGKKMDKLSLFDIEALEKMGEEFNSSEEVDGSKDKDKAKSKGKDATSKDTTAPKANLV